MRSNQVYLSKLRSQRSLLTNPQESERPAYEFRDTRMQSKVGRMGETPRLAGGTERLLPCASPAHNRGPYSCMIWCDEYRQSSEIELVSFPYKGSSERRRFSHKHFDSEVYYRLTARVLPLLDMSQHAKGVG